MELKIKEIKTDINTVFAPENYSETGLFIVNNNEVVWVNKSTGMVVFICLKNELTHLLSEDVEVESITETENTVTEDFALKLVAISLNKEKFKELK